MKSLNPTSRRKARATPGEYRNGFAYVAVISLTILVSIIAMAAMTVARTEISIVGGNSDWQQARLLAQTAIEHGIATINNDPNWRTTYLNNAPNPSVNGTTFGRGYFIWKLVESDNDLDDSTTDPVRVHGIGYVRDTVYAASVLASPTGAALSCLQTSLHANDDLDLDFGTIDSDQIISTNDGATADNGATVNAKVQCNGSVTGATYNGVLTPGYPVRDMPNADSLFDYYVNNGTQIAFESLPLIGDDRVLQELVLSPAVNPFGEVNGDGIYVIHLAGASLTIRNCRIVGTLVIVGSKEKKCRITESVSMEPAIEYFPTLLVDTDLELLFMQTNLSESTLAVNFNPVSTPFPYIDGTGNNQDTDFSDIYPSRITGLVYATGKIKAIANAPSVHGCMVTDDVFQLLAADVSLKYRRTWLSFPPPGFTVGNTMDILPGSWRRETP